MCSARIWAERGDELARAIDAHHEAGGRVVLLTLTMRHQAGDSLVDLWDGLADAWTAARGGYRGARTALDEAGCEGWTRVIEATHGFVNGWHLHVHALLFIGAGATDASVASLGESMFDAWAARLGRHGYRPLRDAGGLDARLVARESPELAEYLSKATFTETSAAAEVAGQHGKRGRTGNRTPWGILSAMSRLGEARDHAIWREWERASKGRRALTWSAGLRDRLLAEPERTDEEIAEDSDQAREIVAVIPRDAWEQLRDVRNGPAIVLEAAEGGRCFEAVDAALVALGCGHAIRPPP